MGRKKMYESAAEKQRAYRQRIRDAGNGRFIQVFVSDSLLPQGKRKHSDIIGRIINKTLPTQKDVQKLGNELSAREIAVESLKKEIKAKDKEIADFKKQHYRELEELIGKIDKIFAKQSDHLYQLAARLTKETEAMLKSIKEEIAGLDPDNPDRKEHLLVIQDSLDKSRDSINKKFDEISMVISDNLCSFSV
ncbi:MAG: hypothetical protein HQL08_08740 [Nitrospirae bacterium]|nr:hypothetical protein [Nitrospirota bacterium]